MYSLDCFPQNFTFLVFAFANSFTISFRSMAYAISSSIEIVASPQSRSSLIVDRRYVLMSLSLEKLLSSLATVTGRVNKILRTMTRLGTQD